MKRFLWFLTALWIAFPLRAWQELDYSSPENWFICEKEKQGTPFDIFYLYPTLSAAKDRILLDRSDARTMKKISDFVKAQTGIFAADARIFVPVVRQLEYEAALDYVKKPGGTEFRKGVNDAWNAFRFYCEKFRAGRPFILIGHSQGAMELYELLKMDSRISVKNGLVAAYLIGLPQVTATQIATDFRARISPAKSSDDLGVIIVWNTQNREAENPMFTKKGGYCINPLNWKTDHTPASAMENQGAFFYDYRNGRIKTIPYFCGAFVDREKGALIVDLPSDSEWDAHGFIGKGVFHMNDIWFFAENTRQNMLLRVKKYLQQKTQK